MRETGSTGLTAGGAPEQGRRGALGQERGDRRRSLRHTASDRGGATGLPQADTPSTLPSGPSTGRTHFLDGKVLLCLPSSSQLPARPDNGEGQRGVGWGAEGAESWHTMLVTAHGWAREAPGASGPQAAPRASNATGVLAAGPLKTCRTFLGPSSSALSSTLPSRPWEVQGAVPSVLCALPTQLHVPFIQSDLQKGP